MDEFKNISIDKKASILYDGHITSRSLIFEDGTRKTLGIMLPGKYELNSIHREVMKIRCGELEVLLPAEKWKTFTAPQSFEIPPNSKFTLKVSSLVDYCCSFIK